MLLTLTTTRPDGAPWQATDLGYLLHKNPAKSHAVDLSFGTATVFYPEATADRCTAAVYVAMNPVELVRDAGTLADYVNDRPYVCSSFASVALGRLFGTALGGRCKDKPELAAQRLPLSATLEVVRGHRPASGGRQDLAETLFAPLGYRVESTPIPLDPKFPEWGASPYRRLAISGEATVHDLLSHLYVLTPVLDDDKHYFIGPAEVDKLLRHGEGWLKSHPERKLIVDRYLQRRQSLTRAAFDRLVDDLAEDPEDPEAEADQPKPAPLHTQRLDRAAALLRELGARSVVDLGCGEGKLLGRLLAERQFERILGIDVSHRALETAARRLHLERMPERQRARIELAQGSLLYRDKRIAGFDAAAVVEVVEHLDPARLAAFERVLFEFARPRFAVVTTPNRDYNALYEGLGEGAMRHGDHRFEWSRAEFAAWASTIAGRFGYESRVEPLGPEDPEHGAPSQLALFKLAEAPA
jgi:3' terminal RNA ribose 2'-O-methyltransferase Hen1